MYAAYSLGDIDGEVTDALEVGIDLDGGDDRAQVDRHRLVQRQELEAAAVDLDVQLVDRRVAGQHAVDDGRVALDESADGRADAVLGEAAHFEQPCLELFELFLKVRNDAIGHDSVVSLQSSVFSRQSSVGSHESSVAVASRSRQSAPYPNRPVT